jgi:hypothetical protein
MAGVVKVVVLVCVAALAAVVSGPADAALPGRPPVAALPLPGVVDRGIVASISPTAIVLTELDGTSVTIQLDALTRVLLNGQPAALTDIRPGFVATVAHPPGGPARMIQAVGRVPPRTDTGIVQTVSADAIVLIERGGSTIRIAIDSSTVVLVNGSPATIADVKPGFLASALHAGTAPARVVRAFRKRP